MPRRSPVLLLSCLLALATGFALLRLSDLAAPISSGGAAPDRDAVANAAVARRFYAAVNTDLATGDPESLDTVLASDFVDHAAAPGQPSDREGLSRELTTLRAVFPTVRLAVTDLVAQGDEVMARVQGTGTDPAAFLGIALPADWPVWSAIDLFRFAGDRIVERWGWPASPAVFQPLPAGRFTVPNTPMVLNVTRVTIAPGGTGAAPGTVAPTLLWVESGAPRVTLDSVYAVRAEVTRATGLPRTGTPETIAPASSRDLDPGDLLRFEDTNYTLRNPGQTPAVLLAVTTATTLFAGSETQGVTTQTLANTWGLPLQPGPTLVSVGQVTLGPGAALPVHREAGLGLVAVESGSGIVEVNGGTAWIWRGTIDGAPLGGATSAATALGPGNAALVADGATEAVRNVGGAPLGALVVTITRG